MNVAASAFPAIVSSNTPLVADYTVAVPLRDALQIVLREAAIEGVASVRLLSSAERYENAHDKVFFVLATHDLERDERIVGLMIQFEGVAYDLVPLASQDLVPSGAEPVA